MPDRVCFQSSSCMTFTRGKQNISDESTISKSMLYIDISTSSFENRLSKLSVALSCYIVLFNKWITTFLSIQRLICATRASVHFTCHSLISHSPPRFLAVLRIPQTGISGFQNLDYLEWGDIRLSLALTARSLSNGCWTRFTCACSARTLNSARPLSPRLTFFIVYRWVSSINILILQVNVVKSQAF